MLTLLLLIALFLGDFHSVAVADSDLFEKTRALAEKGEAGAQFNLGLMYYQGQGVPQNYAQAVTWYRKATAQGLASAQYNLGLMYAKGQGVPQDYAQAMKWTRKAADQGHARAQYNLGVACDEGKGVPKDYAQAHMWFTLAAFRYPAGPDQEEAAKAHDTIATEMTPAQIMEAQKLAREWQPTAPNP